MLKVNRSTYYKHFFSGISKRELENINIRNLIIQVYFQHNKRLGSNKISFILKNDYGVMASPKRVYKLMKNMNLPSLVSKKPSYKNLISANNNCTNHLKQNFTQTQPDIVWVSDITYLRAANRFYYLCVILDLFSRKIIAYKISSKIDTTLVSDTFMKAYLRRKPEGLMFHSDRGSQYTAYSFRKLLNDYNVIQSFSKKGHPYDNAVVECFFKYLKKEQTNRNIYHNIKELESSVFQYIEGYYNSRRPHTSLDFLTPNQKEDDYNIKKNMKG